MRNQARWRWMKQLEFKYGFCVHAKLLQLCPTLSDPVDRSPSGSSVHGILQARILNWLAVLSSRVSSQPSSWTHISYICLNRQAGSLPPAQPGKSHWFWQLLTIKSWANYLPFPDLSMLTYKLRMINIYMPETLGHANEKMYRKTSGVSLVGECFYILLNSQLPFTLTILSICQKGLSNLVHKYLSKFHLPLYSHCQYFSLSLH